MLTLDAPMDAYSGNSFVITGFGEYDMISRLENEGVNSIFLGLGGRCF